MLRFTLLLVVLTGCPPGRVKEPDGTDARHTVRQQPDVLCKDETTTGSMFEHRKCRSDLERQQDHDSLERNRQHPLPGARF